MATRMQKYYKNANSTSTNSRRVKNKDLYGEIYANGKYSNIEGIATIDNANEVDLTKVKELLKNRENYQKERQYRRITGEYQNPERVKPTFARTYNDMEEKNYDIRDILKEAKEKKEPDDKERVLKNTQYNILKNIDLKEEIRKEDYYDEKDEDDLKEMIQTITNTSMLNKLGDKELAEDLFSDLKAEDTMVGEIKDVKALIEANKEQTKKSDPNETTYDRSFFTSSLKLSKSDFEDGEGRSKASILSAIIIIALILVIVVSGVLLIMRLF